MQKEVSETHKKFDKPIDNLELLNNQLIEQGKQLQILTKNIAFARLVILLRVFFFRGGKYFFCRHISDKGCAFGVFFFSRNPNMVWRQLNY